MEELSRPENLEGLFGTVTVPRKGPGGVTVNAVMLNCRKMAEGGVLSDDRPGLASRCQTNYKYGWVGFNDLLSGYRDLVALLGNGIFTAGEPDPLNNDCLGSGQLG